MIEDNIFVTFDWWILLRRVETIENFWYKFDRRRQLSQPYENNYNQHNQHQFRQQNVEDLNFGRCPSRLHSR